MAEHLSWRGYAFESICYKHLTQMTQIRNALDIKASRVGAWRYLREAKNTKKNLLLGNGFSLPSKRYLSRHPLPSEEETAKYILAPSANL